MLLNRGQSQQHTAKEDAILTKLIWEILRISVAGKPDYVRLLGKTSFEKRDGNSKHGARSDPVGPATKYRSNFAYSAPFQVLFNF